MVPVSVNTECVQESSLLFTYSFIDNDSKKLYSISAYCVLGPMLKAGGKRWLISQDGLIGFYLLQRPQIIFLLYIYKEGDVLSLGPLNLSRAPT